MNKNKFKTLIFKSMIFVNYAAVFFLFFSYLAPYISPDQIVILPFLGLSYPLLLLANIFFAIFWLLKKNRLCIISVAALIFGWHSIISFFQITFKQESGNPYKIISYNVRMFDVYKWSGIKNADEKILDFLKKENADIVCLQEFYYDNTENPSAKNRIDKFPKSRYSHIVIAQGKKKKNNFGNAIYSKFRMIKKGEIRFKKTKIISIYADLLIGDDTLRVYNSHLASNHLGYDDYNFIDSLDTKNFFEKISGFTEIAYKFRKAYSERARQVHIIAEHVRNSPYPVFLCGDFNDTPISYAYHVMKGELTDAFVHSGNGIGSTYVNKLPIFRIDYILHSNKISTSDFSIKQINFSDHKPIYCRFKINYK